jgi:predicted GNAT family N-acyltransferase
MIGSVYPIRHTKMQVEIVPHGSTQYSAVVQLRREVLRWPLGLEFTDDDLAAESGEQIFAIFDGNRAIAGLQLVLKGATAKMRQVAVSPELQGKGVGRLLVVASEQWCLANGIREIVLNSRKTAEPFYLALGYESVGEEFFEVGIPHMAMRKKL